MVSRAVQLLADRDAIHDVMVRYTHGVDQRDSDVVRACFAPDIKTAAWHNLDEDLDREELVRFISCVDIFRETMHMMGNQLIEVDGDTAYMDTFAMLTHRLDNETEKLLGRRLYVEKLERRDGAWVIVERGGSPKWAPTGVTGVESDDPAVRWLLDRAEIRDVLVHYTVAQDEGDSARAARVLATTHPGLDAHIDVRARHLVGSQLVCVGADEAWVESDAFVTPIVDGDATIPALIRPVRYSDRLVREGGRWQLAHRRVDAEGISFRAPPPPPGTDDPPVRQLVDRATIEDVVVGSALAVERRNEALLRLCLADDVVVVGSGQGRLDGIEAVLGSLRATTWQAYRTWLVLNNQVVDVRGDEATAETYVYAVQQLEQEGDVTSWTEGARRFVDRLRRDGATWRVVERRVEDNVLPDEKVVARPDGDHGVDHELLTIRARARARSSNAST